MMRLWFALILLLAGPAHGQAVTVTSGEHEGFTRLVFDYGTPVNWQMGRSPDGYELQVTGARPAYDLTAVFELIGKSRLAAIWAVPATGNLHVGLACACYAVPFEFRPGIIVVDLKDGPPPKGTSFELALNGTPAKPLPIPEGTRPKRRPGAETEGTGESAAVYDWTAEAMANLRSTARPDVPIGAEAPSTAIALSDPGLQPLRDTLVQQMARGAAQGVIELSKPSPTATATAPETFPSAQIRIGDAPVSVTRPDSSVDGSIGAQGVACVPGDILDLATWGDETLPVLDQLATHRTGLSGEFDRPEPEAVGKAARFLLYLGFGAEARQMVRAFPIDAADAEIWTALGFLLDGEGDPDNRFDGQAACDGPAALWAVLGSDDMTAGDPINSAAIRLAFASLPLHLRHQIGPALIDRFTRFNDKETARALRDTIARAPRESGSAMTLAEAGIDLANGAASDAEDKAQAILSDPGPNHAEALIALTEARVAQGLTVAPEIAVSLEANLAELSGSELEPALKDALILAQAASGNFDAAFQGLASRPERAAEVWNLLSTLANDADFLNHAVKDPATGSPKLTDDVTLAVARRLTSLGLPGPAKLWLDNTGVADPLLQAEMAWKSGDAGLALSLLSDAEGALATALKLNALEQLGQEDLRAALLLKDGDTAAARVAQGRAGDWAGLAETDDGAWGALADMLPATPDQAVAEDGLPYGPLARGHDLATAGSETRAAIDALLATVPIPQPAAAPSATATTEAITN